MTALSHRDIPVLGRTVVLSLVVLLLAIAGIAKAVHDYEARPAAEVFPPVNFGVPKDTEEQRITDVAWLVGDTVVFPQPDRVLALTQRSGRKVWEFGLPGLAGICGAATRPAGNVAVVVYGVGTSCDTVVGLDVTSGRSVWQTAWSDADAVEDRNAVAVELVGDTVLVGVPGVATAYSAADGAVLWKLSDVLPEPTSLCSRNEQILGGESLVAWRSCSDLRAKTSGEVWSLDPRTGTPLWRWPVPGGETFQTVRVTTTAPVTVVRERLKATTVTILGPDGEPTGEAAVQGGSPYPKALTWLATPTTVYVPMDLDGGGVLTAVDTSGQVRWTARPERGILVPIGFQGNDIIALENSVGHMRRVRIDGDTGRFTELNRYSEQLAANALYGSLVLRVVGADGTPQFLLHSRKYDLISVG